MKNSAMEYTRFLPSPTRCVLQLRVAAEEVEEVSRQLRVQNAPPGTDTARSGAEPRLSLLERIQNYLDTEREIPVSPLEFSVPSMADSGDMLFSVSFERVPDVTLPTDIQTLSVCIPSPDGAAVVAHELMLRLRRQHAERSPVKELRPPQEGDLLILDIEGYLDGYPLPGWCARKIELPVQPGLKKKWLEVYTVAKGLCAGESRTTDIKCPDDYPVPALCGRRLELTVTLRALLSEQLPALDEDFVKRLGFLSIQDLSKAVFLKASNLYFVQTKAKGRQKLLDSILETLDFPLPSYLVERFLHEYLAETRQSLMRQGVSEQAASRTIAAFQDVAHPVAQANAKGYCFLLALARREHLTVPTTDVEKEIRRIAIQLDQPFETVLAHMSANGEAAWIEQRLIVNKSFDYLYAKAQKIVFDAKLPTMLSNQEKSIIR